MTRTGYYVATRDRLTDSGEERTRISVGPFRDRESAERYVAPVRARALEIDPLADVFGTIGTGRIDAETLEAAPANRLFGLATDDEGFILTAESLIDAMTTPDFAVRS